MNRVKLFALPALLTTLAALAAALPMTVQADTTPGLSDLARISARVECASLKNVDLSATVGAATQILSASSHHSRHGEICVVEGKIAPQIAFEAQLPVQGWTQRYLQTGCGGLCGILAVHVDHAETCQTYQDGQLAIASTDMGHEGGMGDSSFGDDPQKRIDFAYRGVHLTAIAVKALLTKFYGQPARYAYFSGCSDGGREALMEAQRYPGDFDGIAAGAPAMNFQVQNSFYHAWMASSNTDAQGRAILTADKLPLLHAAVLVQCDTLDGLKDGQISDPRLCKFDPAVTQCAATVTDTSNCLTAAQVATVKKLYAGPHDAQGHRFVVGSVQLGSELQWRGVFVPETADGMVFSRDIALGSLHKVIFPSNPPADMQLKDFHFDVATFKQVSQLHGLYDATNPDLHAFVGHGGKLLLWHGWADPHISPLNTIAYYDAAKKLLGGDSEKSVRLFLFPGMGHCSNGDGPNQFDLLTPLMAWVEGNHAPDKIIAGRPKESSDRPPGIPADMPPLPPGVAEHMPPGMLPPRGHDMPPQLAAGAMLPPQLDPQPPVAVNRTRPVFAYPQVARYKGTGDVDDAANFEAVIPANLPIPAWMGSDFYQPGFQQHCSVVEHKLVCR